MSKQPFIEDCDNMEEICMRLAAREDIWQDRYIYWIAKALWDIFQHFLKKGIKQ